MMYQIIFLRGRDWNYDFYFICKGLHVLSSKPFLIHLQESKFCGTCELFSAMQHFKNVIF